jgi:hypothetical protein
MGNEMNYLWRDLKVCKFNPYYFYIRRKARKNKKLALIKAITLLIDSLHEFAKDTNYKNALRIDYNLKYLKSIKFSPLPKNNKKGIIIND